MIKGLPPILLLLCLLTAASAGVKLSSHSYIHSPSGRVHVVLRLADYKRGLFFGSCGPSTRSLQWEYHLELTSAGPNYVKDEIELKDSDFHSLPLAAGTIDIDEKKRTARISLELKQDSGAKPFVGNGTFKIQKEP
jgi:hypothetical protein